MGSHSNQPNICRDRRTGSYRDQCSVCGDGTLGDAGMGSYSNRPGMGMRSCRDQRSICRAVEMESQRNRSGTNGDVGLGISTADVGTRHWDPMGASTVLTGTWGWDPKGILPGSALWAAGPRPPPAHQCKGLRWTRHEAPWGLGAAFPTPRTPRTPCPTRAPRSCRRAV